MPWQRTLAFGAALTTFLSPALLAASLEGSVVDTTGNRCRRHRSRCARMISVNRLPCTATTAAITGSRLTMRATTPAVRRIGFNTVTETAINLAQQQSLENLSPSKPFPKASGYTNCPPVIGLLAPSFQALNCAGSSPFSAPCATNRAEAPHGCPAARPSGTNSSI